MLTEIEWWGGLLFLWWAACYWLTVESNEGGITVDGIMSHVAFTLSAVVLALYFYPLEGTLTKQLYVGSLVIGVVALIIVFVWPGSDESDADGEKTAGEDEDEDKYAWLGYLVFAFPMIVSFSLGLVKSMDIVKALGWFG
jgi:hypothetical protein